MLIKVNAKEMKSAYQLCQKAMQFYHVFAETIEHHGSRYPQMTGYKSADKHNEYMRKLQRQLQILLAEINLAQGEQTFKNATLVEENLNMDEVMDSLDLFNNASKVAFVQDDLELEARCEAWIGKLYEKALKKESKAMTHY